MRDSIQPANNRDYAASDYERKTQTHDANFEPIEMQNLPGSRDGGGVEADQGDDQHPMLFRHRSAKLVRRACDFPGGANISSKDRQDGRDVTRA